MSTGIDFAAIAAWIAEKRTALDRLEEAMNAVRALDGTRPAAAAPAKPAKSPTTRKAAAKQERGEALGQDILAFVRKSGEAKTAEIQTHTKASPYRVNKAIAQLVEDGHLERLGATSTSRVRLVKDAA